MIPVLFRIYVWDIHSYGLMIVVGFALGMWWGVRETKKRNLAPETCLDFATWALICGILFARLLFVLLNWGSYSHKPLTIFLIQQGGLSYHGGLAGGLLALLLFCKRRKLAFWTMADMLSPSVLLGYSVARIGCFLNGCCYGTPTQLPWGVRFPDQAHPGQFTPPSHPAQLYSSVFSVILFLLLLRLGRFVHVDGQRFSFFLILTAADRFVMEIFRRGVTAQVLFLGLTQAQVASIGIAILGLLLYSSFERRRPVTVSESHETTPAQTLSET